MFNEIICVLLECYDNFYVDLLWSVCEYYLIEDGVLCVVWVMLIEDYLDCFVLGSDVVGYFDSIGVILDEYCLLLEVLFGLVVDKLRVDNVRVLLFECGVVVED